jgi:hypothetical protein
MSGRERTKTNTQINLRIPESLRRKLAGIAHRRGTSSNNLIRDLIEKSLEADARRTIDDVAQDLDIAWHRFSERFLVRELESDILAALEARDYEKARSQAINLRRTQEANAKVLAQKMAAREQS